jgi:hypothetical protein
MPANAGIQDTTTMTGFRRLARRNVSPPRRVPLDTRFRGYDKAGSPNAVLSEAKQSRAA